MKKNIVILMALLVSTGLFAQGEMDAIRLSSGDLRGTARGQAMGGAFGALGGDVTGIMVNPAGLGLYRSSEINFSLALNSFNMEADWQNTINKETTSKMNFDNVSYVRYHPTGNTVFSAFNFAFSYNRLKNFNRNYSASGKGMKTSLTDYIAEITNGIYYEDMNTGSRYDPYSNWEIPWLSTLGWLGYLINDDTDDSYSGLFPNETPDSRLRVNERGSIESYDFSLGGNFGNKFYLGLTLSLTDMFYHLDASYKEEFNSGKIGLSNYFETEGSGYQVSVGAIWRATDFLRLGVAYHSPTWYYLTDYYQGNTSAVYSDAYSDIDEWAQTPDNALTHYRFNTPGSWVFSAAGILGTKAIVSLDYELKDYRHMTVMDNYGTPKSDSNQFIEEDFKAASTIRAGLEFRFTPQFSGRLGYSYLQNPYEKTFQKGGREAMIVGTVPHYTIEGDVNYFTAGIGYRFSPRFYIDAAFVYRTQKDNLYPFPSVFDDKGRFIVESVPASVKNDAYKGLVTVGFKF